MNVQHSIHIPSFLKVYDNALDDLVSILQNQGINRVVLYFGNDLIEMFGSKVMNSLKDAQVDVLEYKEIDTIALNDITQMAFSISPKAQAVSYRCRKIYGISKEITVYQHSNLHIQRWLRKFQCFFKDRREKSICSCKTRLWYSCRYADYQNRTCEVYLFRNRRYDLEDHIYL